MTGQSPRKTVDALHWQGRLRAAQAFMQAAQQALVLADPGQNANPVISQIVLAAIAYADTVTAKRALVINQQQHAAAPHLLREVLRNTLPDAQEKRFRRILGMKDEVQYGARMASVSEAQRLFSDLESFARWAEDLL